MDSMVEQRLKKSYSIAPGHMQSRVSVAGSGGGGESYSISGDQRIQVTQRASSQTRSVFESDNQSGYGTRIASQSSRSRLQTLSAHQPLVLNVRSRPPISTGNIRRLGKAIEGEEEHKSDKTQSGIGTSSAGVGVGVSIGYITDNHRLTKKMKIKAHIALDTFVAASGFTQSNLSNYQGISDKNKSGVVYNGVDEYADTYQEVSNSLIPIVTEVKSNQDTRISQDDKNVRFILKYFQVKSSI